MEFAKIKLGQIYKLVYEVDIDETVVNAESVKQIEDILNLKDMDVNELRSMRNTIVRIFGILMDNAEEEDNLERMMKLMTKCSGITAVIDSNIWNLDGEV